MSKCLKLMSKCLGINFIFIRKCLHENVRTKYSILGEKKFNFEYSLFLSLFEVNLKFSREICDIQVRFFILFFFFLICVCGWVGEIFQLLNFQIPKDNLNYIKKKCIILPSWCCLKRNILLDRNQIIWDMWCGWSS